MTFVNIHIGWACMFFGNINKTYIYEYYVSCVCFVVAGGEQKRPLVSALHVN